MASDELRRQCDEFIDIATLKVRREPSERAPREAASTAARARPIRAWRAATASAATRMTPRRPDALDARRNPVSIRRISGFARHRPAR